MSLRLAASGLAACLIACGSDPAPDPIEPAELAELCGQTEPVRLLAFEPWRQIEFATDRGVFNDRRILFLHYADMNPGDEVLWSVGPCGEAPRRLLTGNVLLWTLPGHEDPFVCESKTGQLRILDPSAERSPKLVLQLPSCHAHRTELGLVVVRPDAPGSATGDLLGYPLPDDLWTDDIAPVVLLAGVKTSAATPFLMPWDAVQGIGNELFVVTDADELVRLDVVTGDSEVVAAGVRTFELGYVDDPEQGLWPRYILWQRVEISNDDEKRPEGEIILLDRTTGELASLGHTLLTLAALGASSWTRSGLVQLPLRIDDLPTLRLYQLPSLAHVDLPSTIRLRYMLDDDRHMVVEQGEDEPLAILDVQTGTLDSLTNYFASPRTRWWREQRTLAVLPDAGGADLSAEGELWLFDGGGPPRRMVERASYHHLLMPDQRLLTGVNLDQDRVGDLIVTDGVAERLIDSGVLGSRLSIAGEPDDNTVLYLVPKGERAGMWMARLQPRD